MYDDMLGALAAGQSYDEAKLGEGVRGGVYGMMFPHAASAPKEAAVDCGRMFA